MTPPSGGSSKYFSTSTPRRWQYATSLALRIAGPQLPKKQDRTRIGVANQETLSAALPLALRFRSPPSIDLPDLRRTAPHKLAELVSPILPREEQSTMRNEMDVINEAGPYCYKIVQALAPHVLAHYGFTRSVQWRTDVVMPGSRPDVILYYNGRAALVLDFKGPNCIREDHLRRCEASSVASARSKLPTKEKRTLFALASQDERGIVQQGVKYATITGAPCILFYDYDYLFAMEPTRALIEKEPNVLMDVVLRREAAKSTQGRLVELEDNHVSIFLKYVVKAVSQVA